mmetsp:Transcript_18920/g.42286  ORF Transcript_18920/g.42286 Transcript_18920/m.42286 type:complete len:202 (-) Transcript_18920:183-788(-)
MEDAVRPPARAVQRLLQYDRDLARDLRVGEVRSRDHQLRPHRLHFERVQEFQRLAEALRCRRDGALVAAGQAGPRQGNPQHAVLGAQDVRVPAVQAVRGGEGDSPQDDANRLWTQLDTRLLREGDRLQPPRPGGSIWDGRWGEEPCRRLIHTVDDAGGATRGDAAVEDRIAQSPRGSTQTIGAEEGEVDAQEAQQWSQRRG